MNEERWMKKEIEKKNTRITKDRSRMAARESVCDSNQAIHIRGRPRQWMDGWMDVTGIMDGKLA